MNSNVFYDIENGVWGNIWTHIIMTWNDNNSNQTIPYDTPIPDYMSLITKKKKKLKNLTNLKKVCYI